MNDKKAAPRRSTRTRTVDLEATEIVTGNAPEDLARTSASVEAAATKAPAGPVEDGKSEEDDAAMASIESAFARPTRNAAKAPPETENPDHDPGTRLPVGQARRGPLFAAALLGGAVPIGIIALFNAIGMSSAIPGLADPNIEAKTMALQEQVSVLNGKVATLETASENPVPAMDPSAITALEDRVAKVEAEGKRLALQVSSAAEGAAAVSALGERVGLLEKNPRMAASSSAASGNSAEDLSTRFAPIEAELDTSKSEIASLGLRVSALETSLAEMSMAIKAGPQPQAVAARTLAATALRDALAQGEPFADLVGPLEMLVGKSPVIDRLRTLSAGKVATYPELLSEFENARSAVAAMGAKPADGVLGRLLQNARSLVSVEPDGPIEGNSPGAVLSRVKAGLSAGDAAVALAAWQELPQAERSATAFFGDRLSARAGADTALADVMNLLGQTGG